MDFFLWLVVPTCPRSNTYVSGHVRRGWPHLVCVLCMWELFWKRFVCVDVCRHRVCSHSYFSWRGAVFWKRVVGVVDVLSLYCPFIVIYCSSIVPVMSLYCPFPVPLLFLHRSPHAPSLSLHCPFIVSLSFLACPLAVPLLALYCSSIVPLRPLHCRGKKQNVYIYIYMCADANMCTCIMCRCKKQCIYIYTCADANMCTGIMCKKKYV